MSQDLTTTSQNPNAGLMTFGKSQHADDTTFEALVRSAFLPRVQLCGGNNDFAKEGKIGVGRFAFIRNKDDFVDLTNEFQFFALGYRFAAMKFAAGNVEQYFNPNSDDFKRIQAESEEKDSKCAYGPQFLLWVPAVHDFATFLFGSKSSRPEGRNMRRCMDANMAGILKSRLVSSQDYKWHVPAIIPYSGAIDPFDVAAAKPLAERFLNPGDSNVETEFVPKATADTTDASGRVM